MYIAQSRCDHRKICYLFDLILCLIAEPYLSPPSGSRLNTIRIITYCWIFQMVVIANGNPIWDGRDALIRGIKQ